MTSCPQVTQADTVTVRSETGPAARLFSEIRSLIEDLKAEKQEAAELELTAENDIDANVYSENQITLQGVIDRLEKVVS